MSTKQTSQTKRVVKFSSTEIPSLQEVLRLAFKLQSLSSLFTLLWNAVNTSRELNLLRKQLKVLQKLNFYFDAEKVILQPSAKPLLHDVQFTIIVPAENGQKAAIKCSAPLPTAIFELYDGSTMDLVAFLNTVIRPAFIVCHHFIIPRLIKCRKLAEAKSFVNAAFIDQTLFQQVPDVSLLQKQDNGAIGSQPRIPIKPNPLSPLSLKKGFGPLDQLLIPGLCQAGEKECNGTCIRNSQNCDPIGDPF